MDKKILRWKIRTKQIMDMLIGICSAAIMVSMCGVAESQLLLIPMILCALFAYYLVLWEKRWGIDDFETEK